MLTRRSRSNRPFTRAGAVRGASHRILAVLSLGVPLAIVAQALTSCGSDSEDRECTPGEPKACVVAGQTCEAIQTCNNDGSAYSECACPGGGTAGSAGAAGSGGSSSGGAAGSGGAPNEALFEITARAIGAPCAADADCPVGPNGEAPLFCVTSTTGSVFGEGPGGPQGGYCSVLCDSTAECQALDALAACSGAGYCLARCQPGDADGSVKCVGANDTAARSQACLMPDPGNPGNGACVPICESDAGCGDGLFCDLGRSGVGLCTPTAPVGGDVGAPCAEATADADCKSGLCLTYTDAAGANVGSFCSAVCVFGLLAGCGFDDPSAVPREALCAQTQDETGGGGDLGFCLELCDTDVDCAQAAAGWVCSPLSAGIQAIANRTGVCDPPSPGADAGAP